jgi:cytochrome d ubiquinol oxidase subunit II
VILMYSGWSHWVFRGKVRRDLGYHCELLSDYRQ